MVLKFSPFEETEFGKEFWQMFWVSLILHIGAILIAAFSRDILPRRVYYAPPSFTTVDLVTMEKPKPSKAPVKRKPAPPKPKAEKKIPIPETHKKTPPTKPAEKAKPKPEKAVVKKKPPAKEYSDKEISSSISNLKKKVDSKRAAEQQAIAARGRITSQLMEIKHKVYYNTILAIAQSEWAIPEGVQIRPDLEAIIGIRIDKKGSIIKIDIEKSSGNNHFDSAAIRTIERISPLPVPPGNKEMEVGFRFTPEGLQ